MLILIKNDFCSTAASILPIKSEHCGAVCLIYCPFRNVLDERGCPICRCNQGTFYPKGCGYKWICL